MWLSIIFNLILVCTGLSSLSHSQLIVNQRAATPECVVKALGSNMNDVPNIQNAFTICGNGGKIVFPEGQDYYIAEKLNPIVKNVEIEWRGRWTVSIYSLTRFVGDGVADIDGLVVL
jgi:hypothetical protein